MVNHHFNHFLVALVVTLAFIGGVLITLYVGYFPLVEYNAKFTPVGCTSDFTVLRECPLKECYCVTTHLNSNVTVSQCDKPVNVSVAVFTSCYPTLKQAEQFQSEVVNMTFACAVTSGATECYLTLDPSISITPMVTLMITFGFLSFFGVAATLVFGLRWHQARRYRVIPEWSLPGN